MLKRTLFSLAIASSLLAPLAHAAPSTTIAWEREGTGPFDDTGAAVGTAGDVNCDGYSDLIIGVPRDDQGVSGSVGSADSGTIEVWFGSASRPATNPNGRPDWHTYTGNFGGNLGAAVAAGDFNGDGCDDILASEPTPSFPLISPQKVHVYLGPLSTVTQLPDANLPPPDLPEWSATLFQRTAPEVGGQQPVSVAAGDVSGDGIADVIVGQPEASNGQQEEGVVMVWLGSQSFASKPDGTVANVEWMAQSDQAGAHLGESVASAFDFNGDGRDDIAAGAPDYNGVGWAFVWLGSPVLPSVVDGTPGNKAWSLTVGGAGSRLGQSVATAGDFDGDGFGDLLIGAPLYDSFGSFVDSGAAFLMRGGNPMPASDLFSFSLLTNVAGSKIGTAVASAGDVNGDGLGDLLFGEPEIGLSGTQSGRVHLILGRQGYNSLFAPAPAADAIYTAPNTINNVGDKARFGAAAGTAGDWNGDGFSDVIVGAPRFGQSLWGKAYVFLGRGDTLASEPVYTLRSGQAGATNGLGVAFAGDVNGDGFSDVVTGAPNWDGGEGAIFMAYGGSCGPDCAPFFEFGTREGGQAGMNFGWTVNSAGDVNGDGYADVIVGSPLTDNPFFPCPIFQDCTRVDAGGTVVYHGGPSGLSFSANWGNIQNNQAGSQYGYSATGVGDVNGDGYGDVLVAAPYYDGASGADEGRVFLYLGSASGLSTSTSWFKTGSQAGARFGIDVAGAGDVNGDGYSDVIIGATGAGATGAAYLYLGRPTTPNFPQGLWNTPIQTFFGIQADSAFGINVATAGDVNRDGYADVVVGAPEFDDDPFFGPQTGAVFVYHGAPSGPATGYSTLIQGGFPDPGTSNRFGNGVAGAGDVNLDGFDDLIVGDQWWGGQEDFARGRAFVFHGGTAGVATTSAREFSDCPHAFCDFGRDVAGQGDVNGDGFSDVLIAAYGNSFNQLNEGAVFVHLGNEGRGRPVQPLQSLGFGGTLRALLGSVSNWFDHSMNLRSPAGRSRVELEVEPKPIGTNFDGLNLVRAGRLDNVINPRATVSLFGDPNQVFAWRARLKSASPIFGRSPWFSLPGNAAREMDIRVLPEPGVGVAVMAGLAGFAALARSRRARGGRPE